MTLSPDLIKMVAKDPEITGDEDIEGATLAKQRGASDGSTKEV